MRTEDEGRITCMPQKKVNDNMVTCGTNFFDNKKSVECKENVEPYDKQGKSHFVYECDAADIDGSYIYPAMARSFRETGFQWATQFAYDPLVIAPFNTDYQTHYVNLLYTPSKAVSLRITAEAFRSLPRNGQWGNYPENNQFADFLVDYQHDISLLNRDTLFCYSNTTNISPV